MEPVMDFEANLVDRIVWGAAGIVAAVTLLSIFLH
jgi:hypothetical protein